MTPGGQADQSVPGAPSVCVVVLTYNRQNTLRVCLAALLAQTRRPDQILVVDNASSDSTPQMLAREFPGVEVLALSPNVGAAGGFSAGMAHAYSAGYDWLWLMDDDAYPDSRALELLLDRRGEAEVLVPWQVSERGERYGIWEWRGGGMVAVDPETALATQPAPFFTFIGPLIARAVIGHVGLPYAEYFIDFFDWEYSLRIHQAGLPALLVAQSRIDHEAGQFKSRRLLGLGPARLRYWQPAWRMYYDTRNALLTYRRRRLGWKKIARYVLSQPRAAARELLLEPDGLTRLRLRLLAVSDGLRDLAGERPGLHAPSAQKAVVLSGELTGHGVD